MSETEYNPKPGIAERIQPSIRRILAPNPSPMTFKGTNTYLVGSGDLAIIDPGPNDKDHLASILAALQPGERITHIFVTHSHLDHSPLAAELKSWTGAPILAFGDSLAGRSDVMKALAMSGFAGGGEGVDHNFAPDIALQDGQTVKSETWSIKAIWTPGHFCNHMSFAYQDVVFTGDVLMGWASTMVSPPDGDLGQFMQSMSVLSNLQADTFLPGHGDIVSNPMERANFLRSHRQSRETEILAVLEIGQSTIKAMTQQIYRETSPKLWPAAERNVFAHLIDLYQRNIVTAAPALTTDAEYKIR